MCVAEGDAFSGAGQKNVQIRHGLHLDMIDEKAEVADMIAKGLHRIGIPAEGLCQSRRAVQSQRFARPRSR